MKKFIKEFDKGIIILFIVAELIGAIISGVMLKGELSLCKDIELADWERKIANIDMANTYDDPLRLVFDEVSFDREWDDDMYRMPYRASSIEYLDSKGQYILKTKGDMAVVTLALQEQDNYIYVNLIDTFDQEQIDKLFDVYYGNNEAWLYGAVVKSVEGYYGENNNLVITGIELTADTESIKLTKNADKDVKILDLLETENVSSTPYLYICKAGDKAQKKLDDFIEFIHPDNEELYYEEDDCYNRSYTAGDNVIRLHAYFDAKGAAVHSPLFKYAAIRIIVCMQLFVLLIVVLYWDIRRRQRKFNAAKDYFINAMAHELKTPVAVIQNTSEYIQTGMRPEKLDHYLEIQKREAKHIDKILGEMLRYSRLSSDFVNLDKELVDLKEIVDIVSDTHKNQMQEMGITYKVNGHAMMKCDKALIEMVIDNLVSNAIKYGKEGCTIEVNMRNGKFSVFNSGSVINKKDSSMIFEPMYRGDEARKADGSSGMGLSISKNILQLHGATIGFENKTDYTKKVPGVEFYFNYK